MVNRETPVGGRGRHHLRVAPSEGVVGLVLLEGGVLVEDQRVFDRRAALDDEGLVRSLEEAAHDVTVLHSFVHKLIRASQVARASRCNEVGEGAKSRTHFLVTFVLVWFVREDQEPSHALRAAERPLPLKIASSAKSSLSEMDRAFA